MSNTAHALRAAILFVCLAGGTNRTRGQTYTWLGVSSNQWNVGTNWASGTGSPNSSSANVSITNLVGNKNVIISGINPMVGNLTIGSAHSLTIDAGAALNLDGSGGSIINNLGAIHLSGGGASSSYLTLDSNTALASGGTVTLSVASGGGSAYIEQGYSGVTLTNQNNTIQGVGVVGNGGLAFINWSAGTVNANTNGQALVFNGGAITNAGLFEASGGGTLQLSGMTFNNLGGNITANPGGAVQLLGGVSIEGGTLNNSGGWIGTVTGNTASLDGKSQGALTINGNYTSDLNTTTQLSGTINNNGNFQLNGGNGTNSYLNINGNATLQGGGTLTLNVNTTNGGNVYVQQSASGLTLTNFNNTIQGAGVIGNGGLAFVNDHAGTVLANAAGQTLEFNGGTVTNSGTFQVNAGSLMAIDSTFTTSGTVNIGALSDHTASLLQMLGNNDYVQTGGTTTLWSANSTLEVAANQAVRIEGGVLQGFGTVQGNLINSGSVHPGDGPGTLSVNGNYSQTSSGVLDIVIGGPSQGSGYGWIDITGTASLAGTLDVSFYGGFVPTPGEEFTILTSSGLDGSMFQFINGLQQGGLTLNIDYTPGGSVNLFVAVQSVPEPGSVVLLGLGFAGLCAYGYCRRRAATDFTAKTPRAQRDDETR